VTLAGNATQAGVVGPGSGGFPTHVKLAVKADTTIANGERCEPPVRKHPVVIHRPHLDGYREVV
jgi:Na+-translocating ferredoxin:NAD+ oxidoreductase RnfC subunit